MRKNKYQILQPRDGARLPLALLLCLWLCTLTPAEANGFYDANEPLHIYGQGNKQISDINILLPISTCTDCRKIVYNISAINGCYQWEVSHPNLIDLLPYQARGNVECANIAQLQAISQKPSKSLIWISARDRNSGQVLRCEAKLGVIQKLDVQTHLRQFYVDDYEHLHIAAYDDEGNIFNSLEGFRFEWNIETGTDVVKIVSMKEVSHKSSDLKREMEFSKLHSDFLFLKGLKTGTATLSVRLMEPGYEHVPTAFVTLTITEPFVIIPQKTVYLLPTSKFQFQLAKVSLKNHDMQFYPISLPSRQYQWNIDSEERADIGEDGLFLSKDKEGFVNIFVVDQYIANNTAEGSVKIVHPSLLDLEIVDVTEQMLDSKTLLVDDFSKSYTEQLGIKQWDSNWILVEGNYYLMKVFLFDREKQPIFLTENLVFQNILDEQHFEIVKLNKIKSEFIVRAKKATSKDQKLIVTSMFKEILTQSPYYQYPIDSNRLRSEKEVRITLPVSIIHPTDLVLLPIIKSVDEARSGELWQLHALGGSGYYQWSIINDQIASISGSGLVKSKEIGLTKVLVRDTLNSRNFKTIDVEVTPVFTFTWLEDHIEIQKNVEQAYLSVIALDQSGRKFTNCTAVMTQFEIKGEGVLQSIPVNNSYTEIQKYVQEHKDLMFLKQRFDENPQAQTINEFTNQGQKSPYERQEILLHNNFGVCQIHKIMGTTEGLGRVKAYFSNYISNTQSRLIESNYAEIASYEPLQTIAPSYANFFSDLYSKHLVAQEEQNFNRFYSDNIFDVAFGSSAQWEVQGGTNFWKDAPENYQVIEAHFLINQDEYNLDKSMLHFETVNESATKFKYSLTCYYPGDKYKLVRPHFFRVNVKQQNMQNRHLLRPANHSVSIEIHCEPPKDLKLFWAQEEKSLQPAQFKHLPRHKLINGEKNHFVLVNSRHFLRSLIFDTTTQVFYNHSSILTPIKSSNDQMLQVHTLVETYDDQVKEGIYDKRRIEVSNITGTVYINAQSQGYIARYLRKEKGYSLGFGSQDLETETMGLSYEVKDQMKIEVVQNVDIQPKYKSIYINKENTYKFQILHGSGHFSVSINNTDLADRHHIEGDRFITIYPKKEGPIEIRVEDIEIPDSVVATAELLISDIHRLELDAPGTLIEQGSQMDLLVTAFDLYNQPFDFDQYLLMKFHIEIEITQQRERGLAAEQDSLNNRVFVAKGQEPGLYQVTAISTKYRPVTSYYKQDVGAERQRVTSEVVKIEVFPLLQIQPSTLLLTPEMKYTLQIVGGPSRSASSQSYHSGSVEIRFDIEDKNIASVDVFREVTGHEVGDTKLYYEIIQLKQGTNGERRSIVSKKTIPIRIRLVTDIEIPYNNQRNVYSGSMIKLIGILKYHQETFTHGIAPISYSWNCSNPNILSLNTPSKADIKQSNTLTTTLIMASRKLRDNEHNNNDVTFLTSFNSSTIYSIGGKQGEALVTLQLAIEYPEIYRNDKNWFTTKIIVRVNEKLSVEVPEYINSQEKQTHLFLMPPNAYTKIETNKKTRLRLGYSQQSVYDYSTNSYQYKDSSTPIIQLINDEGIKTFDKYGKVTVIIEENQAFSDQVVMLNILITDIYNMASKDAYQALSFPLGSLMNIPLKFQNEHAHTFAKNIEGIEVGIELSHPRVVSAQLDQFNQTIQMRAEGSGECNVIVYLVKQPHIYDVFRVRVSSVVKPYSPVHLHVGGQVQFKIMDQTTADYSSKNDGSTVWSSNNPTVLDINQATGDARGLAEGRAEVLLSNHISAASIAQVSKVRHAEVDEQSRKNLIINTDDYAGDVRVRVKLYLHDQIEELTPTVQFDGITLIRQNVGILCESEHPDLIEAKGEVNELEGFFCILSYKGSSQRTVPKNAKVHVTVYAPNPNKPQDIKSVIYRDQILSFEIAFISKINVESYYRNGISLNKDHRTATIKIFSNTHFNVHVENDKESDKGYDLVKFRVNKTAEESTEYFLTVTVPREITHDFTSKVILTHPTTGAKTQIPVIFQGREGSTEQFYYAAKGEGEGILSGLSNLFTSKEKPTAKPEERAQREERKGEEEGNFGSRILIPVLIVIVAIFFMINVFSYDPAQLINSLRSKFTFGGDQRPQRYPGRVGQSYYGRGTNSSFAGSGGAGIRSSNIQSNNRMFPQNNHSFLSKGSPSKQFQSPSNQPQRQQRGAVNLDRYPFSGGSDDQSIYQSQDQ